MFLRDKSADGPVSVCMPEVQSQKDFEPITSHQWTGARACVCVCYLAISTLSSLAAAVDDDDDDVALLVGDGE